MRYATRSAAVAALVIASGALLPASGAGSVPRLTHRIVVDSTADAPDANPLDATCRTSAGTCTLRAAIQTADALPSATVVVPAGTYRLGRRAVLPLTQAAVLGQDPANGYLAITGKVTVQGAGVGRTVVDGGGIDRVFGVRLGATAVINDLTVTGGNADAAAMLFPIDIALGGGILNFGNLTVQRVALVGNHADGGGGLFSAPGGRFVMRQTLVADNTAVEGGGVRADMGGTIIDSTITRNTLASRVLASQLPEQIVGYGGGIDYRGGGDLTIIGSTITDNYAYKAGGGLNAGQDYVPITLLTPWWPFRAYVRDSAISGNRAGPARARQNCHTAAMVIRSRGGNVTDDPTCRFTAPGDTVTAAGP